MKQLYVVEFPLLEGIPSIQDFFFKFVNPSSKMLKHKNPIAIFASEFNRKTRQYEMKVVAIQTDSHKSKLQFKVFISCHDLILILSITLF